MPIINVNNNTDLEGVLGNGGSTGGQIITGPNGELFLIINNTIALLGFDDSAGITANVSANASFAQIDYTNGAVSGIINIDLNKSQIYHDLLVQLNSANIELTQETASLILSTDANKNIKGLSTTTYPSLTEFSYGKGVESPIQPQLYRSFSPFQMVSVVSLTGSTAETIIYTSSPNLVGKLLSGDMLMIAGAIQATNNANVKTLRFYISDSQSSLSNEVLIGTVAGTTGFVNTANFDKILTMTSIATQNVIAGTGTTTNTGTTMGTTAINFGSGSKYLVVTLQLATGTDTVKLQFGRSTIHRG